MKYTYYLASNEKNNQRINFVILLDHHPRNVLQTENLYQERGYNMFCFCLVELTINTQRNN